MILTRKFVFIHMAKTGGTFATTVLKRVVKGPRKRGYFARLRRRIEEPVFLNVEKHGPCTEIPRRWQGRPILSVIRNPYDHLLSHYRFDWWKSFPPPWVDYRALRRRFPTWPDVSFEQFQEGFHLYFRRLRAPGIPPEEQPGCLTEQFLIQYFREPAAAFRRIDDAYLAARGYEKDMYPVKFLRMERLNQELRDALVDLGYPEDDVEFILCLGRIVPPETKDGPPPRWEAFYTPELKAQVRRRERLLFSMFPEYDR